jgi:pimeloyl-ACP methyl ester carboxylesterase
VTPNSRAASTPRTHRTLRAVGGLLLAVGLVAGCGSSSSSTTEPTASASAGTTASSSPSPSLAAFYDQHLSWHTCHGTFQCSTLVVPMDYATPTGRRLHLAVIRKRATGTSHGSLVVNPGGPGASGVDFVVQAASSFAALTRTQDLVSFDPRGVGGSDPIRCTSSAGLDAYIHVDPAPTTTRGIAALVRSSKKFAAECYARNGSYLEHVGTIDSARDMDVLRAALGDTRLTYYGGSYGTFLGAEYAQLFPTKVRALVLDGAIDPTETALSEDQVQGNGFETDLHDFLSAESTSLSAGESELRTLERRVEAHPVTVGSRSLGPGEFFEGLAAGLYSTSDWPVLRQALEEVADGNGQLMLELSDSLTGRNSDGSYSNLTESNVAINCVDRPVPKALSVYEKAAAQFAKTAPDFGAAEAYSSLPCAYWKVPSQPQPAAVHAVGAPPILVVGNTRDPATPYVWAKALASQLSSGRLLTDDSDGHTAYLTGNTCIDDAVDAYLLTLKLPAKGTTCHSASTS